MLAAQHIFVDIFVCLTKGQLFNLHGEMKDEDMYCGGAIFIDMASTGIVCVFQKHVNTNKTMHAKEEFELQCQDVGVIPQEYISDNGSAFTSQAYTAHL